MRDEPTQQLLPCDGVLSATETTAP
jgi:hypothetical protein